MKPTMDSTLRAAREWLTERLNAGESVRCPVCTQHAKVYKRGMTRLNVQVLRLLAKNPGWQHLPTLLQEQMPQAAGRGQATLAHFWGLMEQAESRPDSDARGYWRITPKGISWLAGRERVPRRAVLYAGRLRRFEGEPVGPADVLPGFDYGELMSR